MTFTKKWTNEMAEKHKKAAKLLEEIKNNAFNYIRKNENCNEYEVQQFIAAEFKKNNLTSDKDPPIVAFGENTSLVHYFATKEKNIKLSNNCPILIDIWAKLNEENSVYADITWIGYKGEVPSKFQKTFDLIIKGRDECLKLIEESLKKGIVPKGYEADTIVRDIFKEKGLEANFKHTTGHSLGEEVHGIHPCLDYRSVAQPLLTKMGYTIEPGLYFEKEFGVRSEIDFYIDNMQLIITTVIQKEIVKI